jgi:3D (Asp-Asp-Asp) domain-containing protein/uncharacterized protein YxeA
MKVKVTFNTLIYVILIQIALINVVGIFVIYKNLNAGSGNSMIQNYSYNSEIEVEKADEKEKETGVKNLVQEEAGNKTEESKEKDLDLTKALHAVSQHNINSDVLKELYTKTKFSVDEPRDLKLWDQPFERNEFVATAYDLSYESCGKYPSHPAYGITFSGTKAVKGRTIAVDPEVIPLGSSVYIEFPNQYSNMDGWYIAEDTGSKVKGKIIDVFFGESALHEMKNFGRRNISVKIVKPMSMKNQPGKFD